jgi:hypothetical protein
MEFYIHNAGLYLGGRPSGGIGTVNSAALRIAGGGIINANFTTGGATTFVPSIAIASVLNMGDGDGFIFYTTGSLTAGTAVNMANYERMRITSAGNVGIGTSSPFAILTTSAPNAGAIGLGIIGRPSDDYGLITFRKNDATTTVLEIGGNIASGFFINNYYAASTSFATNAVERLRISSTGRVGVGTSSTGGSLDRDLQVYVTGGAGASSTYFRISGGAAGAYGGYQYIEFTQNDYGNSGVHVVSAKIQNYSSPDGTGGALGELGFYTKGATGTGAPSLRMTIASNGSIGAPSGTNIYNASDVRLKRNVTTITNGLSKINALNPVKFNWIEGFEPTENEKDLLGFIAQEVQSVIPEAIESFGNSVTAGTTVIENPLRVNEKFIIPVLVKAIQELKAEIEELKNK